MNNHILIVDDVTTNLRCANDTLREHYQVTLVKSGREALVFLQKNIPDLILLDILMPGMDGYETFRRIREIPSCAEVPVIFLSADTGSESTKKGLLMGAADYIGKPFDPADLTERIERVLKKCRNGEKHDNWHESI